ncbi:MAG: aspartate aminotransferase family protein [Candidatus Jordarchaeum sp.]|uniref:aspartate aminotransferase family protein n=1 Tax=Candidatus Jordarchaeum sp. TaxID=2823881 RepID=UPI004049B265
MGEEARIVSGIVQEYMKKHARSKQIFDEAWKVMPGANTRIAVFMMPYPAYITRGEGSSIWDVDGNQYVDLNFNMTCLVLGHKHPKVVEAINKQIECGTSFGGPTEHEVELAKRLIDRIPSAEQVRFTPSGTEAVHQAVRLARAYTKKDKIIKCEGAYHGTWDAIDISVFPTPEEQGPPLNPNRVPFSKGIPQGVIDNTLVVPFNNIEVMEKTIKENKDDLAAVILEPIQRGYEPKEGYLEAVREITEKYGILLIFDEVVCYRVRRGGAQELYGVTPDITTLGKLIGGGFPIGAYVSSREIMKQFSFELAEGPQLFFSGTFNAFPLAMVAGAATLDALTPDVYEKMDRLGEEMRTGLSEILSDQNIEAHVGGVASFFHIFWTKEEVVDYRTLKTADTRCQNYFDLDSLNRGIYYRDHPNVSAVTTREDVKKALDAARETVEILKPVIKEISPGLVQ